VFTAMRGIQAAVYDSATIAIWVHEKQGVVARDSAPMMRIDEASPLRLAATEKPQMITVPPAKARGIIEALYARRKIVVRWYDFPHKDQKNFTVESGDFGAAYDHAVKVCGWSRLKVKRRPLSKEPEIYKGDKGYLSASFGGSPGWTVMFMPQFGSCSITSPGVHTLFSARNGHPESVPELGEMIFFDGNGQKVDRVVHEEYSPAPITAIMAAARKAGEYGIAQLEYDKVSLFGFLEAVKYAEKTCKVSVRSAIAKPDVPKLPLGPPSPTAQPTVIAPRVAPLPDITRPVITPPVVTPPKVASARSQEARSDARGMKPAAPAATLGAQAGSAAAHGLGMVAETGVPVGNTDPTLAYYFVLVQDKITGNWTPPKMGPGTTASVNVSLRILRSGQVRDLAVDASSGDPILDDSALRAVRLSTPLPPLPPLFKAETLYLPLRFTFVGEKN